MRFWQRRAKATSRNDNLTISQNDAWYDVRRTAGWKIL